MNLKFIPFLIVLLVGIPKAVLACYAAKTLPTVTLLLLTLAFGWLQWTYWRDKDMPTSSGNFKYEHGQNEFMRALYAIVMLVVFLAGAVYA